LSSKNADEHEHEHDPRLETIEEREVVEKILTHLGFYRLVSVLDQMCFLITIEKGGLSMLAPDPTVASTRLAGFYQSLAAIAALGHGLRAPCALYLLLEPFLAATDCANGVFMSSNVAELFQRASELSEADRATLAALLIESLEPEQTADIEAAWAVEIKRRVAELDAGAVTTVPWSAVREELQRRLRERS
jgi:putative addiction module component (TIGR02574 family)